MVERILIPRKIRELMEKIEDKGGEVYVVGGAVRDLLLDRKPGDWDLATSLNIDELERLAFNEGYTVIKDDRAKFGIITFSIPEFGLVDIAQFRAEEYTAGSRKPKVKKVRSLKEDVIRRDFTINALAADSAGRIIDLVGGLEDIRKRRIRFVGSAIERIKEDPLRALRFVRFAAYLDFEPDWEDLEKIRREGWKIFAEFPDLSWERIGYEIEKAVVKGSAPYRFLPLLWYSRLHRRVMPELDDLASAVHDTRAGHYGESVLKHTYDALKRYSAVRGSLAQISPEQHRFLSFSLLLHDIAKPETAQFSGNRWTFFDHWKVGSEKAERILRRWRRPVPVIKNAKWLIRHHHWPLSFGAEFPPERIARKAVAKFGKDHKALIGPLFVHAYADTGEDRWLDAFKTAVEELNREPPLVTGRDILALGVPPGRLVGRLLSEAKRLQYEEGIKDKDEILRRLKEMMDRIK